MSEEASAQAVDRDAGHRDLGVAFRNALKLGGSLLGTWAVALVVRFQLPRLMGPERFGAFNFADSASVVVFTFLGFGVDTYIQKEIAVRPEHASDFFGGIVALRAAAGVVLLGGFLAFLHLTGRGGEILEAGAVFGLAQIFVLLNASLGALLQAATKVGKLAVVNVVTKLLWGGGLLMALHLHAPMWLVALPVLISEATKTALLASTVRRVLALQLRVHGPALRAMLRASLPFFVNTIAFTVGGRLDVTMMEYLASNKEVGWYSAASSLSQLALLVSPLMSWVLMPLLTRAKARSEEEFFALLRRSVEAVMMCAIPATMFIAVGADFWVRVAFGPEFGPAAPSLRILAPSFVLTYANVLLATALIILERSWTVTLISLGSLSIQPFLILVGVPLGAKLLGEGGAGIGNAAVFCFLELFSVVGFWIYLGRRAIDRKCASALLKALGSFALVVVAHRMMLALGPWRIAVDTVLYAVLVLASRAVTVGDLRALLGLLLARRRGTA
jgi:O-antigen/teichoic acid export membrane protein